MMHMGCGNRGMTGADRELMQIGDDVADGVEPGDCCLLMRIDEQSTNIAMLCAKLYRKLRAHVTSEGPRPASR
jgi:hypothetical protein